MGAWRRPTTIEDTATTNTCTIRPAASGDHGAIRALLTTAFDTTAEADLVEALRRDGDVDTELVAITADGALVGHVLTSRMAAPFSAVALAPVAVDAAQRRRGIAAELIDAVIDKARRARGDAMIVLGDPAYYARFGFDAACAAGFSSPYAGPYLMALALQPGGLPVTRGKLAHAPAFAALG